MDEIDAEEELYELVESIRKTKKLTLKKVAEHLSNSFPHLKSQTFGYNSDGFRRLYREDSYGHHACFGEYLRMLNLSPTEREKIKGLVKKVSPPFGEVELLSLNPEQIQQRLKFLSGDEMAKIKKSINEAYVQQYNKILD